MVADPRQLLLALLQAAVEASLPAVCVPPNLPTPPSGRTIVVGAGKASASMAKAVEDNWSSVLSGIVVTRYGHGVPCKRIEIVEAGHPVPDEAGLEAARRILDMVRTATKEDLVLGLMSGGGSALLALPAPGITLADKQAINRALLRSGANISEMNCVRKHLSAIKGGRLAIAAAPARVVTLMISDVPGDDPAVIASGPTVGGPSTRFEAMAILEKYHIDVASNILAWLKREEAETPKPGDMRIASVDNRVIATPQQALEAAAAVARAAGIALVILSDSLEGEAHDVGSVHAAIARQCANHGQPISPPCVLLSGGETTVTVRGNGRGGRNAEFLLAAAIALNGSRNIYALAADTDGIDGTEDNAGAIVTPDTLERAARSGLDARAFLQNNDAYSFFSALGDLVVTGPTLTNVNDFRALLILDG